MNTELELWEQEASVKLGFFAENTNTINFIIESINMDMKYNEMFDIVNEGALETIKDKIVTAFQRFLDWLKGLKDKIVNFFKGGATPAKKVEENFRIARDGTKLTKNENGKVHVHGPINKDNLKDAVKYAIEAVVLEADNDEKIKAANEEIYKLMEENQPMYVFRTNAVPWREDIDILEEDLEAALQGEDVKVNSHFTKKLEKYDGDIDKYIEDKVDTFSSKGTISANANYVHNGLEYFMKDFMTIDKYIESTPKYIDRLEKMMQKGLQRSKTATQEQVKALSTYVTECSTMQKILNKYLANMIKTRKIIVKISNIARDANS